MIVARTLKGKGVSICEGKDGWHGKAFKKGEELDKVLAELRSQLIPGDNSMPAPQAAMQTGIRGMAASGKARHRRQRPAKAVTAATLHTV